MELAGSSGSGAIRLAGWRAPGTGLASDRCADLNRMPMTARTAGAPDDELDRSGNTTKALPHRWLRPLDGGLPTGAAMASTNKS
jgi:hypothetical protein